MPLYIGDYLSDTMHLSLMEHGAYLMLLMAYWKKGGPLPADDKKLSAICRISISEFKELRPALEEFFAERDAEWVNPRADKEIKKWGQMKDDRGYGAALANFKKFGTPIPEKYAERHAERNAGRNADTPLSVTPSPSPLPKKQVSSPKKKKHAFEDSPIFDKATFRAAFPDWSGDKCREWYTRAVEYSGANGGRYLDWKLAIQGWERKQSANEKPKKEKLLG